MLIEIIAVLFLLHLKHFICDYPLQTDKMIASKGVLGDVPGVMHSCIHGFGTFLVFVLFAGISAAFYIAVIDVALHYTIDFTKKKLNRRSTPASKRFWTITGADQFMHNTCYLLYVLFVLS